MRIPAMVRVLANSGANAMQQGGYTVDILVQGYPGKSVCHGLLGWSTIVLLRGHGRVALIDVGSFGIRRALIDHLAEHGLTPGDVTDVLLTHAHWDHSVNWTMFAHASVAIGSEELAWATTQPWGLTSVPELYMRELDSWPTLRRLREGDEALPGLTVYAAPGHTPGSLIYVLTGREHDIVFTGDAAKNRAELSSGTTDMTVDAALSTASLASIWRLWSSRPGTVVIPGHDLPMVQENREIRYIGSREAAVSAWFSDELEQTTIINLAV